MDIFEQVAQAKYEEAFKKGEKIGKKNANCLFVENLLRETNHSLPKIASLTNTTHAFVKKVKKDLAVK